MDNSYIIYDIITAVTAASAVLIGMKKGFLRAVLSAAVWLAAFIGAAFVSEAFSEPIYQEYFRPKIVSVIEAELNNALTGLEERISQSFDVDFSQEDIGKYASVYKEYLTDSEISDKINSITDAVFSDFTEGLKLSVPVSVTESITSDHFNEAIAGLTDGGSISGAAEYIEERAVRRIAVRLISCAVWSVSYAVMAFIGRIILSAVLSVRSIPTVRSADRLLGGVLGLAAAFLILVPAAAAVRFIVGLSEGSGFFSETAVNNTLLFKYFYNLINIEIGG